MLILTDNGSIPRHFMRFSALIGFVMATSWVYLIANEVVSTLTMFGVISRIDAQVIGLTVLAWSNSAGDLVSDIAVARQKIPRMAFTATIAGPLFNLLIGFGIPFLIAAMTAKEPINLEVTTVTKVMLIFLGLSLGTSLILLPVQKFFVRRSYAVCLYCIYLVFLLVVVLAAMRVFHF